MQILVVKLADLGDLLLSEPALRSLRAAYPHAHIDVLTSAHAAALLPHFDPRLHPLTFEKSHFDALGVTALRTSHSAARLARNLRSRSYDSVVILHHLTTAWGAVKYRALAAATGASVIAGLDNGRGDFLTHAATDRGFGVQHEIDYMLAVALAAGGANVDPVPRFAPIAADLELELPGSFVALAPGVGAYASARAWPIERFVDVASGLAESGHAVVVVGGAADRRLGEQIVESVGVARAHNLAGRTNVNELALLLKRSAGLVGNDSFPAHLAAAIGTPTLAIFGPSNRAAWAPRGDSAHSLSLDLPCSPCLYTGYQLGRRGGCPARSCLTMIAPKLVLERTLEMLGA